MINLEARMKLYEDTRRFVTDGGPIIARLDGKNFHAWTKGLDRPFDIRVSEVMMETAEYMARKTNALLAYTQSDEISLTWNPTGTTEPIYGGKVQKIVSLLASECSNAFNSFKTIYNVLEAKNMAMFDCRVFQVPDIEEGASYFMWREADGYKNAISMAAQSQFSHKELQGKHSKEMLDMLNMAGVIFSAYPEYFRNGTYWRQERVVRKFTNLELTLLPPKHEAYTNPDLEVERIEYKKYHEFPLGESRWIYG